MSPSSFHTPTVKDAASQTVPILCLLGVVALLSTITPTMKYVFQNSTLTFLSIATGRVVIGFVFLATMTSCLDRKGLRSRWAEWRVLNPAPADNGAPSHDRCPVCARSSGSTSLWPPA